MKYKYTTVILVLFCAWCLLGCGGGVPETITDESGNVVVVEPVEAQDESPPKFQRGDIVARINGKQRMIVVKRQSWNDKWQYDCIYQEIDFEFYQDDLRLVERFDWAKDAPIEVVPEVTSDTFEESNPK